jgi:hypothetical protein
MPLCIFEMPERPKELARWMEQKIVGLDLAFLVAELRHCQREVPQGEPDGAVEQRGNSALQAGEFEGDSGLDDLVRLLGRKLLCVLKTGLGCLSEGQLKALLRRPARLLLLQEVILVAGDLYWRCVPVSAEQEKLVREIRRRFRRQLLLKATVEKSSQRERRVGRESESRLSSLPASTGTVSDLDGDSVAISDC